MGHRCTSLLHCREVLTFQVHGLALSFLPRVRSCPPTTQGVPGEREPVVGGGPASLAVADLSLVFDPVCPPVAVLHEQPLELLRGGRRPVPAADADPGHHRH